MSALRSRALAAYRSSLRATQIAFKGDTTVLNAARAEIKKGHLQPDETKTVEERIKHLEDINKFLLSNIVQAKRNDESNKFRLNIHEHTELGDNESIKKAKKTLQGQGQGCCGSGAGAAGAGAALVN